MAGIRGPIISHMDHTHFDAGAYDYGLMVRYVYICFLVSSIKKSIV